MAAFLAAIKRGGKAAGKAIGRYEKQRFQSRMGIKPGGGSSAAGSDPVADAAKADMRDKKRSKTRE